MRRSSQWLVQGLQTVCQAVVSIRLSASWAQLALPQQTVEGTPTVPPEGFLLLDRWSCTHPLPCLPWDPPAPAAQHSRRPQALAAVRSGLCSPQDMPVGSTGTAAAVQGILTAVGGSMQGPAGTAAAGVGTGVAAGSPAAGTVQGRSATAGCSPLQTAELLAQRLLAAAAASWSSSPLPAAGRQQCRTPAARTSP